MAKSKHKYTKKHKSFSDLHGSKSDMFKGVTPEQLGHDKQIGEVNPQPQGGSPLINPGQAGHPINPDAVGQSMPYQAGDF